MINENAISELMPAKDSRASKDIRENINFIVNRIKKKYNRNCKSIILVGSLAAGEASYFFDEKGLMVLSDYDFLVITNMPHFHNKSEFAYLTERTPRTCHDIDISNLWYPALRYYNFNPERYSIYLFSMKSIGKTLYGRNVIPKISISEKNLPKKLDINEFFNRAYGLLWKIDSDFLTKKYINNDNILRDSTKVVISCAKDFLLSRNRYSPSLEKIRNMLYEENVENSLLKFYEEAMIFRYRKNINVNIKPYWKGMRKLIIEKISQSDYKTKREGLLRTLSRMMINANRPREMSFIIRKENIMNLLNMSILKLLLSFDGKDIDKKHLTECKSSLLKLSNINFTGNEIEDFLLCRDAINDLLLRF